MLMPSHAPGYSVLSCVGTKQVHFGPSLFQEAVIPVVGHGQSTRAHRNTLLLLINIVEPRACGHRWPRIRHHLSQMNETVPSHENVFLDGVRGEGLLGDLDPTDRLVELNRLKKAKDEGRYDVLFGQRASWRQ
jgi:hypothetical protein